jgi:hypothetical protein
MFSALSEQQRKECTTDMEDKADLCILGKVTCSWIPGHLFAVLLPYACLHIYVDADATL